MFVVLCNPTAGSGRAASVLEDVCALLKKRAIAYRIEKTTLPGHATELARKAALSGCHAIVGIGGDGTLSEIIAGLTQRATALYFVPCGTGNDFVRMLNLPADPVAALEAQLDGQETRLDMATVNCKGFLNVAGTGFDVEVLREVTRFKHVGKGLLPYLLGLIAALRRFKAFNAELVLDNGEVINRSFTIISIANGRYFGGGMKVAPLADVHDGLLDVMMIDGVAKFFVPFLLPFFVTGKHIKLPICRRVQCKKVTLTRQGMTFNMDGELYDMDRAEVEILPGHLPVRLPNVPEQKKHAEHRRAA